MVGGEIWKGTTPAGTLKTQRVVQPCSGSFLGDGFQIAFGNQTIFLPALSDLDEGRRLSALRPYLTAGLPLSVQSILERSSCVVTKPNAVKHDILVFVKNLVLWAV